MATVREFPERTDDQRSEPERVQRVQVQMAEAQRRPRRGQPFFPVTIFGSAMYILVTVGALIFLAITNPAPLQHPADPLNNEHVNPRPEWYFLFLFQVLKIFGGPLELIGTVVIPGILALILIGLPFYDRNWSRRAVKRPIAIASASIILFLTFYLTYVPLQPVGVVSGGAYLTAVTAHPKWSNIEAIFSKNCQPCHYAPSNTAGLNLSTYQSALQGGNGAGVGAPKKVIIPGNAKGSYLWQVIEWRQDLYKVGGNMPAAATQKIPQVDRDNIANWINDGAKNNG